ncbi:MAG: 30S ribosomal protein S20 [Candidatus Omnitrophica bacterium]|jgi:small subunit ribosomal protein S20|nr:30S ribosomal protein S20 [Candidatus Omnitrophota bacterium]
MPIKHSALKELRKDPGRRQRNQAVRSELKTLTRQLLGALEAKQPDQARALLQAVVRKYDRAASKGIIHSNTANRSKSRLAVRVNRLA